MKDAEGNVVREEEVKKSRKSNKEHQMVQKKKPKTPPAEESCGINHIDTIGKSADNVTVVIEEKPKKKKSFFSR